MTRGSRQQREKGAGRIILILRLKEKEREEFCSDI
jgi:hypothetical protein